MSFSVRHFSLMAFLVAATLLGASSGHGNARLPQLLLDEAALLEQAMEERGPEGKRGDASAAEMSSLWFGPRLGRRRRSPPEEVASSSQEEEQAEALVELLREAPWALLALRDYPGGKRQTLTFTPRLGRELQDALSQLRSPPFSPRLGRGNGLPFSPRLGRQQEHQLSRTVRSATPAPHL